MKSRNFSTSYNLLAKSINQAIQHFLTNCFTFLTKFLMFQVRKSRYSGISLLFPVLFYEWNTSINVSFWFWGVFLLGIISWKGALLFNGRGFIFKWGRHPFCPPGASALMGRGFQKNHGMPIGERCLPCTPSPPLWETL